MKQWRKMIRQVKLDIFGDLSLSRRLNIWSYFISYDDWNWMSLHDFIKTLSIFHANIMSWQIWITDIFRLKYSTWKKVGMKLFLAFKIFSRTTNLKLDKYTRILLIFLKFQFITIMIMHDLGAEVKQAAILKYFKDRIEKSTRQENEILVSLLEIRTIS